MKRASMDVRFRWRIPDKGHRWARSGRSERLFPNSGGNPSLDPKLPGGTWEYTPTPDLFRKFAALKIADKKVAKAQILAFANEYGDVIAQPQEGNLVLDSGGEITKVRKHATRETWCRAIQHMRRAVDLWDSINDPQRHKDLRRSFVRSSDPRTGSIAITYRAMHHPLERKVGDDSYTVIASGKDVARYRAEDTIQAARRALQLEMRAALTDSVTPSHSTPDVTPELELVMNPVNLLAYMWLTFARVVSGEIEERLCEVCHEVRFYVGSGPGLHQDSKVICGAACRKKKQRDSEAKIG